MSKCTSLHPIICCCNFPYSKHSKNTCVSAPWLTALKNYQTQNPLRRRVSPPTACGVRQRTGRRDELCVYVEMLTTKDNAPRRACHLKPNTVDIFAHGDRFWATTPGTGEEITLHCGVLFSTLSDFYFFFYFLGGLTSPERRNLGRNLLFFFSSFFLNAGGGVLASLLTSASCGRARRAAAAAAAAGVQASSFRQAATRKTIQGLHRIYRSEYTLINHLTTAIPQHQR